MWALMGGLYFFQGKRMNEEEKKHIRDSRSGFGHDKESVVGFHKSRSSGASKKVYILTGKRWIPSMIFSRQIESCQDVI